MTSETAGKAPAMMEKEKETLLTDGDSDEAMAPLGAARSWRMARLAIASGVLLAAGALAAGLATKLPGSRPAGAASSIHGVHSKAEAADPAAVPAKSAWNDEDSMDLIDDPCKNRKRRLAGAAGGAGDLGDLDLEKMVSAEDVWDPCKVSKEAAVKAEKMLKQAAHWEVHKKAKAKVGSNAPAAKSATQAAASAAGSAASRSSAGTNQTKNASAKPAKEESCSGPSEDCSKKKCCSLPGMQCFAKNKDWAECRAECAPGPHPSDANSDPWSCKEIGKRSAGEAPVCVESGVNCLNSKCCSQAGATCYKKNSTFASCKQACTPGPDYEHEDYGLWTCEAMGSPTPGKADWVDQECSGDMDDCTNTRCCQTSGYLCYEKGEGWAQCKAECTKKPEPADEWDEPEPWTCKELGGRTPQAASGFYPGPHSGKVAPWVKDHCSKNGVEDCSKTQCCLEVGAQCYMKEEGWAVCKESCTPGPNPYDNGDNWTCDTLGTRSYGLATKGWPSLFCFLVMRTNGYELPLVQAQWEARSGVFNCDGFVVFADKVIDIADTKSLKTPDIAVGISQDGTAGNTELFMAIWEMLFEDGRLWNHDWTIKADPDAVLLPDRLRSHLAPHTGWGEHDGKLYVVNCNAWPSSASFPMLYGAVEVFSNKAMATYAEHVHKCKEELPWSDWGEDFFLTRCMDQIGVGRLLDFSLVGDNLCTGPGQGGAGDCDSAERAAFHPFKSFDDWMNCFNKAIGRI